MQVDSNIKEVTCEFCGTKFMVDDETKSVEIKNAEKTGYDFEKGRQKAIKEKEDEKKRIERETLTKKASITKKQKKRAIIIGVILAVFLAAGITGAVLLRTNQPLYTKLSIAMMPDHLDYTDSDGKEVTFYIEENKDYDSEKDDPIDAYSIYYFKDEKSEEKTYLENGVYMTDTEYAESVKQGKDTGKTDANGAKYNEGVGANVITGFMFEARANANKVSTVFKVLVAVFAICCVAYLIYLWYLNWSVRYDKKKEQLAEGEEILNKKDEE